MMKVRKILLSGCLVATLCSCGGSQNENLNLTLSKDALFDKVKGAWAGQVIGCTYGGPTEFRYLSTMIPDSIVMPWGPGEIKKWYDGGGGLYDDVYVDLTFVETFERYGLDAPADSFATAFLAKEYPLCHANQMARYNLLHGLTPPASGHWKNNPHANCLDFQIEADFAGIMAPGMVNSATEICDRVGHIMAYGDGWYGGVYVAAMYSLAYVSDDVEQYANMTPEDMRKMYEIFYPTFSNEKFARLMKAIDLPQNKRMSTFSKGMKRQAAVVCGLAASTDILLLDEAFDGLDPTMRISVRKMLFDAMTENESTVVISSHNLTEIEELCDSVGLVHKGKVIFDRELDSVKGSIHKVQVAFDNAKTATDFAELEILSENTIGSVQNFIVNGDSDEICRVMREKGAKFCDVIPLTLNEGQGYDSSKLDR